jgi:hypothetical protein
MRIRNISFGLLIIAFVVTSIQSAFSIPAFARKYRISCSTCHAPAPKLKAFGEEFAGNGFVMEGKEPKRATIDTGDPLLLLQREFPLALRLDAYAQLQPDAEGKNVKDDLQTPYILKILSGGQVYKSVSYYFYFFFSERGEVAGIEDAYLHFNDLFGAPFDIMVGQFQVSDPLFKRELRLTFEDYQVYRVRVGHVPTNLTYDRGLMLTYTAPFGSDLVGEIVNGNGKDPARENRQFDNDGHKNYALRWTHEFPVVRVGLFGMYGKSENLDNKNKSELVYYGPDATVSAGPFEINLQYLWRQDDNPFYRINKPADKVETKGGLAEVVFSPQGQDGRWFLIGLYNKVSSNVLDINPEAESPKYESAGLTATYLIGRNLRIMGEYTYDIENKRSRFVVGFVSAF